MPPVNIHRNGDQVGRLFANLHRAIDKQTAIALTNTARDARDAVKQDILRVFDRPTRWVQNGVFFKGASDNENAYISGSGHTQRTRKNQRHATVWFKDDEFHKGIPAAWMMAPQVYGGSRRLKRMEKALQRVGVLPVGMYIVPGDDAKLDIYGNLSRGQIVQILAWFSTFHLAGYRANMTAKTRARLAKDKKKRKTGEIVKGYEYFAISQPGNPLPPGVYQRFRYGERTVNRCVLFFISTPVYQKRLPFFETVERTVRDKFNSHFAAAVQYRRSRKSA